MAKSKLTQAAVKIGTVVGTAERKARKAKEAAQLQRKSLEKKFNAIARELKTAQKALKKAVAAARG